MTGLDEISFKLGKIMSDIDGLKEDVRDVKREVSEDREATDRFREEIRDKVKTIGDAVEEISPYVEDYKTLRQKIGVAVLLVSTIGSGAAYLIWQGLVNFWPVIRDTLRQALK